MSTPHPHPHRRHATLESYEPKRKNGAIRWRWLAAVLALLFIVFHIWWWEFR